MTKRLLRYRSELAALAFVIAITIVFFWKLALTDLILVGTDVFTYFYPYRTAVNEALQQGRLPLWNPYLYMGTPLLANGQAGFFYPLNWAFANLGAPYAVSYSIVLHVALAGVTFYLFMRVALAATSLASLTGAVVFALGGYAAALVEHVNQLQAAAWLPLLLLCVDRVSQSHSLRFALFGGIALGFQLLAGHAQVTYISLCACGLWLIGKHGVPLAALWLREKPSLRLTLSGSTLPRSSVMLIAMGALGSALAAVQVVPMLELSQLSIRSGGMTFREAVAFSLPPTKIVESLLPTFGTGELLFSEYVGFVGVAGLLLAAMGLAVRGRSQPALLLLTISGIVLAVGVFNPLYWLLYKAMPGFGLFRVPARWLLLYATGTAAFCGLGIEALATGWRPTRKAIRRFVFAMVAAVVVTIVLIVAQMVTSPAWSTMATWVIVAATGTLLMAPRFTNIRLTPQLFTALVCVELFAATRWMPYNQPTAPEAFSALRPAIAYLRSEPEAEPYRILSFSDLTWDPGDLQETRLMFGDSLSRQEFYEYTVAVKAKEMLVPNLPLGLEVQSVDGYDGGILPLARFVGLQRLLLPPEKVNPDGRLRERLTQIPDSRWLDLFNVRYIIMDKNHDVWVDGIYYDLGLGARLRAGEALDAVTPGSFAPSAVGVISYLVGAQSVPTGTPVAEIVATLSDGSEVQSLVRAGTDTAEGEYQDGAVAHARARAVAAVRASPSASYFHSNIRLDGEREVQVTRFRIRSLQDGVTFVLGAVSLLQERTGTGSALTLSGEGSYQLVHSGDVKIYERQNAAKRAIVYFRSQVIPNDEHALNAMRELPEGILLLAAGAELPGDAPPDPAQIDRYEAEHVSIRANGGDSGGYLLLKDAWFPGWYATVDGQPASIERAFTFFRAVRLPAGVHRVEMRYAPESLAAGAAITCLAFSVVSILAVFGLRRARIAA